MKASFPGYPATSKLGPDQVHTLLQLFKGPRQKHVKVRARACPFRPTALAFPRSLRRLAVARAAAAALGRDPLTLRWDASSTWQGAARGQGTDCTLRSCEKMKKLHFPGRGSSRQQDLCADDTR